MSTIATIKFEDEYGDSFFVYRSHDGFPENVMADIKEVIEATRNRWSGSEMGQLVAWFLVMSNDPGHRILDYEMITGFAGDESHKYLVKWNSEREEWTAFESHRRS